MVNQRMPDMSPEMVDMPSGQRLDRPSRSWSIASSHVSDSSLDPLLERRSSVQSLPSSFKKDTFLRRRSSLLGMICWLVGIGIICWFGRSTVGFKAGVATFGHSADDQEAYSISRNASSLEEASPIIVTDGSGRARWTVSIPATLAFPFTRSSMPASALSR